MKLFYALAVILATTVALPMENRVTGGSEAEPHSIPYQIGLAIKVGDKTAWCGGSLISNRYVLTAAHCLEQAESVAVYLGAHNIKDLDDGYRVEVPKENLIVHEMWSMLTLTNDIGLVKLPSDIEFTDNVQPINLPRRSAVSNSFAGYEGIISGWGKDSDTANAVTPNLQVAKNPILANWKCNVAYLGRIKSSHICLSTKGGVSTCQGDSGGPMAIQEEDGSRTIVGLTSFGIAFGCEVGYPGVFTRVTSYLDWISEQSGIAIQN